MTFTIPGGRSRPRPNAAILPIATTGTAGIVSVDGTIITITSAGQITTAANPVGANPSGTGGPTAVNGSSATFMRSDGAPAIQKATTSQLGLVQADGTTVTITTGGVISAVQPAGANPTAAAGATAVNGVATTFMRSDGAPAVVVAATATNGIVKPDNVTIKVTNTTAGTLATIAAATVTKLTTAVVATTTTSIRMAGIAAAVTPARTGNFLIIADGYVASTVTTAGIGMQFQIAYGTATAPASGAAATGTTAGSVVLYKIGTTLTAASNMATPSATMAVATGLAVGTAYWIDVQQQGIVATGINLNNFTIQAIELV